MMKHAQIIRVLDEIDKYLIKNVDSNGKINNSSDINIRMYIGDIKRIKEYLEQNDIKGAVRSRVEQTEEALVYLTNNKPLGENNQYFNWVDSKRKQKDITHPNEQELYYDIITGHQPMVFANYVKDYLPQLLGREELIKNIEIIEQEYEEFLEKDKTQEIALTVTKKKNKIQRIFDKILKTFRKPKEVKSTSNTKTDIRDNKGNISRHHEYCKQLTDYQNYNQNISETIPTKNSEQVIAISDLHGNIEKWNKMKDYMSKNPNTKVMILGDAMDRGEYGLEILLQIKELCDQGKAEYLPGNHDIFAYNYVKTQEILSRLTDEQKMQNKKIVHVAGRELAHLEKNGGEVTINSLNNFDKIVENEIRNGRLKRRISKEELINWLGNQPIQKKTDINNTTYALAHAWFDDELYNKDKEFNLEKALMIELYGKENDNTLDKFRTVMWYRQENPITHYSQVAFPDGCTMVVGHTVQIEGINVKNFNDNTSYRPIIYIDTGRENSAFDLSNGKVVEYGQYQETR